jgi:hypothetical protein
LAYGARPEPCAGAIRHKAVERDAEEGQINSFVRDVRQLRQVAEGRAAADGGLVD